MKNYYYVYFTPDDFSKLSGTISDERLKQAKLATNKDLNTVKNAQSKMRKKYKNYKHSIQGFFICKNGLSDDGFQNMFVYHHYLVRFL